MKYHGTYLLYTANGRNNIVITWWDKNDAEHADWNAFPLTTLIIVSNK